MFFLNQIVIAADYEKIADLDELSEAKNPVNLFTESSDKIATPDLITSLESAKDKGIPIPKSCVYEIIERLGFDEYVMDCSMLDACRFLEGVRPKNLNEKLYDCLLYEGQKVVDSNKIYPLGDWLRFKAKKGSLKAQFLLGYTEMSLPTPLDIVDLDKNCPYLCQASNGGKSKTNKSYAAAGFRLAFLCYVIPSQIVVYNSKEYDKNDFVAKMIKRAAKQGHPIAKLWAAQLDDYENRRISYKYLKSAAKWGAIYAQYLLGLNYAEKKKYEKAKICFANSAAQGYKPAQKELNRLFHYELVTRDNLDEALDFYPKRSFITIGGIFEIDGNSK